MHLNMSELKVLWPHRSETWWPAGLHGLWMWPWLEQTTPHDSHAHYRNLVGGWPSVSLLESMLLSLDVCLWNCILTLFFYKYCFLFICHPTWCPFCLHDMQNWCSILPNMFEGLVIPTDKWSASTVFILLESKRFRFTLYRCYIWSYFSSQF